MNIREATPAEVQDVIGFYYTLIDDMQSSEYHPKWQKDVYPTRQQLEQAVNRGEVILAEEDSQIVGAMVVNHDCVDGYRQVQWQVEASDDQVVIVHLVGVSVRCQGQGIASRMMAYAENRSKQRGIRAMRLDVLEHNLPARKAYPAMGFTYIQNIQLFYEDTGVMDFLMFEKAL